jgi:hypothetical protein
MKEPMNGLKPVPFKLDRYRTMKRLDEMRAGQSIITK